MIQAPQDAKTINPNAKDDGIQLPFPAPVFYWRNGDARMMNSGGVQYYGGWETQDSEEFLAEFGEMPKGFEETQYRWGSAVTGRALTIAPIVSRKRWIKDKNHGHSQTLCLVATRNEAGKLAQLGTIIVSVKSLTVKDFSDAIKGWSEHTKEARTNWATYEDASGKKRLIPSWYFWQPIGTFGDFKELKRESKRKAGEFSMVTVPENYLPVIQNEAQLNALYVGNDIYRLMGELSEQAKEWANDERWIKGEEQPIQQDAPQAQPKPQWDENSVNADMGIEEPDIDSIFPA